MSLNIKTLDTDKLPKGFTYLMDPRFILTMAYSTSQNFLGRPAQGYYSPVCIMSEKTEQALIAAQDELDSYEKNQTFLIYDAYRPTTAVQDFIEWSQNPQDERMKALYYPTVDKINLFNAGYIAKKSGHSRGSTIDLTIVDRLEDDEYTEWDMGSIIDFFGRISYTDCHTIPEKSKKNRMFLKRLLEKHGFENYEKEWWHYSLKDEPFPETYFDFPVR